MHLKCLLWTGLHFNYSSCLGKQRKRAPVNILFLDKSIQLVQAGKFQTFQTRRLNEAQDIFYSDLLPQSSNEDSYLAMHDMFKNSVAVFRVIIVFQKSHPAIKHQFQIPLIKKSIFQPF